MKLIQKALILIVVPLVFEIILIFALIYQNNQIAKETQHVIRSESLVQAVYQTQLIQMDAVRLVYRISGIEDRRHLSELAHRLELIKPAREKVIQAVRSSRLKSTDEIDRLLDISRRVDICFERFRKKMAANQAITHQELTALLVASSRMTIVMSECARLTKDFASGEWRAQRESALKQQNMRRNLNATIIVGLLINVALALGMASGLNRNTIRRLNLIMKNADRIGQAEPLETKVSGNDEISELDSVLHTVSKILLKARQQEQEVKRMKENFYAMVTHDLRSPLTSVSLAMELVIHGSKGDISEESRRILEKALLTLERVFQVINDFLDLRKLDANCFELRFATVSAKAVVGTCKENLQCEANEKGVVLNVVTLPVYVNADEESLTRVVSNLMLNAIKVSSENDEVTVRLSQDLESSMVRFEICDQGPTIEESRKDLLFAGFKEWAGPTLQGSGLGLVIAKLIVDQHGGQIGVLDNASRGNIFWFTLPSVEID